jgi:hypothetical protein
MTGWVANTQNGGERWATISSPQELRGDAEDRVNELSPADRIALRGPADLPFRIACIASYPSIVLHAPSAGRKPKLAVTRFLMTLWGSVASSELMCNSLNSTRHDFRRNHRIPDLECAYPRPRPCVKFPYTVCGVSEFHLMKG